MVSVVIPTYNRCKLIGETVDSVLAQSYCDLEVIVVDDGSTDGTGEYLKSRYAGEPRFRYIWQENAERAVARNTGVKTARGEYVAFLDSDDLWLPNKLEAQMRLLLANPEMVMAVSWFELIDEENKNLQVVESPRMEDCANGDFAIRMVTQNRIGSPTPVIKRRVLFEAGLFCLDSKVLCFEDWEMWTRVSLFGKVGVIPIVLARHRIHSGNTEKPLMAESYLASVASMKKVLNKAHWLVLKDAASRSYWSRLKKAPPDSLYRRTKALAAGIFVFGKPFCAETIASSRRAFIRFLIGPAMLSRLRKVRATLFLGLS